MSPSNTEVLEKKIYKPPLLCRFGWHKWKLLSIHYLPPTTPFAASKRLLSFYCPRVGCGQGRTEVE